MNYFNPYMMSYPYYSAAVSPGLFSKLFSGINFSSILSGTQKTLNFANQALPLVKQISPMMKNAKTMFRVMNEFKKVDTPSKNYNSNTNNTQQVSNTIDNEVKTNYTYNNGPTFFN